MIYMINLWLEWAGLRITGFKLDYLQQQRVGSLDHSVIDLSWYIYYHTRLHRLRQLIVKLKLPALSF